MKPEIKIVADLGDYLIIEKPALVDSQNSKPGRASVVDWLVLKYGYAGLVHRLDFGTSGLMVCAKTAAAAASLTDEMQAGRIEKTYHAIVFGKLTEPSFTIDDKLDEKDAVTHCAVIEIFPNATLVKARIETGRKHQIRRHLAGRDFPLIGDTLYGKKGSDRLFNRPALHASSLVVFGKEYTSELPQDMQEIIERWRKIK